MLCPPHRAILSTNARYLTLGRAILRGRRAKVAAVSQRQTIAYLRVSTEDQATNGVSLAAQEERIRAYCVATKRQLDEVVIDDGHSAKSLKRPGMQRILAGIRAGKIDAVVVLKLDRLTRSVRDLADLLDLFQEAGAALVSISETLDTSTATGRLIITLIGTVSQWEREAIGERTAFALAHKRRHRQVYGPVPFGFRREGQALAVNLPEQDALQEMKAMEARGASLRQIARALERLGVRSRGSRWHPNSVRVILKSRMSTES